jgi:hypothetical protein
MEPAVLVPPEELEKRKTMSSLYKPIENWQTRLLSMLPGHDHDIVSCNLLIANLGADEEVALRENYTVLEYEAVSYCWGEERLDAAITCNGLQIPVTRHCASALRHLRYPDKKRHLWIDFICINQKDEAEKSRQVRNMFKIYRKATSVLAWLGVPTLQESAFLEIASGASYSACLHPSSSYDAERQQQTLECGIQSTLMNPWFSRLWVRQETMAARNLVVVFGRYSMPYGQLKGRISFLTAGGYSTKDPENNLDAIHLIFQYGKGGTPAARVSAIGTPLRILISGKTLNVLDSRDRTYGALGILSHLQPTDSLGLNGLRLPWARFPIDYRKTVSEVFQDLIAFLVEHNSFHAIPTVYESRRNRRSSLASWAIDWRLNITRYSRFYYSGRLPHSMKASEVQVADITRSLQPNNLLRVQGYEIGTVELRTQMPEAPGLANLWGSPCEKEWRRSAITEESVQFPDDLLSECHYVCVRFSAQYWVLFSGLEMSSSPSDPRERDLVTVPGEQDLYNAYDFSETDDIAGPAWSRALVSESCTPGDKLLLDQFARRSVCCSPDLGVAETIHVPGASPYGAQITVVVTPILSSICQRWKASTTCGTSKLLQL